MHYMGGATWRGARATVHCDNMAVVEVVNLGYSKDGVMAHLLRVLFFAKAHWEVEIYARAAKHHGGCLVQK